MACWGVSKYGLTTHSHLEWFCEGVCITVINRAVKLFVHVGQTHKCPSETANTAEGSKLVFI